VRYFVDADAGIVGLADVGRAGRPYLDAIKSHGGIEHSRSEGTAAAEVRTKGTAVACKGR